MTHRWKPSEAVGTRQKLCGSPLLSLKCESPLVVRYRHCKTFHVPGTSGYQLWRKIPLGSFSCVGIFSPPFSSSHQRLVPAPTSESSINVVASSADAQLQMGQQDATWKRKVTKEIKCLMDGSVQRCVDWKDAQHSTVRFTTVYQLSSHLSRSYLYSVPQVQVWNVLFKPTHDATPGFVTVQTKTQLSHSLLCTAF